MPAAVAFAALFVATQVTQQIPATGLVAVDVAINAIVTDRLGAFERQAPADLLGRQPWAHIALHLQPAFGLNRARIATAALALLGQCLSLRCPVARSRAAAPQLAANRAGMTTELSGNLASGSPALMQGLDLISFFLSQVCVGHRVS